MTMHEHNKEKYSDTELITLLQMFAKQLGRTPIADDIKSADSTMPDITTYERRFGTWHNALHAADLEPKYNKPKEKLIGEIVAFMLSHEGRLPRKRQFTRSNGLPAAQTLRNRFGSVSEAQLMAAVQYSHLMSASTALEEPEQTLDPAGDA